MNRRDFLEIAVASMALVGLPGWAAAAKDSPSVAPGVSGSADAMRDKIGARRNVVFILADDLGYMDIGANNPKTFYETPNIDRLAAQAIAHGTEPAQMREPIVDRRERRLQGR